VRAQRVSGLVGLEAVVAWVDGEGAEQPGVEGVAWDVLEQQPAAGFEDAGDLGDCAAPVRDVLDGASHLTHRIRPIGCGINIG
jgi:hypothetical protein